MKISNCDKTVGGLVAEYIHHYNHERPHQALGDFVPAEVFSEVKIIS
ncbi:hypothetical protein PsalMR5_04757 (plasmid) [Piscirickettsia salmonis]|nr:hypothetical protein PsalSR1_04786 [Piscirickettsia salmonis]QGP61992.1 hypothetical protein PsalBI1_04634 [Piscirickettsia salmonis]QGP66832.1 hypothetical protein PsalMR5_04757 [Piscirickettsia salmonis]